jgi:hypothetical protein
MSNSPKEIISPIWDKSLLPKISDTDARSQGRIPYDKPTPANTIMLFIDHQIGLMAGIRDFSSDRKSVV